MAVKYYEDRAETGGCKIPRVYAAGWMNALSDAVEYTHMAVWELRADATYACQDPDDAS